MIHGLMHTAVGNVAGEYLLACDPEATKEFGVQSALRRAAPATRLPAVPQEHAVAGHPR
jgi:hypothetical protein